MMLFRESKKVLHYLFETYIMLLWFYVEYKKGCCTIYLNLYSFAVILCRASKKVKIFISIHSTIYWNIFPSIVKVYEDHQRRCYILYWSVFTAAFIAYVDHHKGCPATHWYVFSSAMIAYREHMRRFSAMYCNLFSSDLVVFW